MKFFRREAIPSVHAELHIRYKYMEHNLGLNYDEELEIKCSYTWSNISCRICIGTSRCTKKYVFFRLDFGLDSLHCYNHIRSYGYIYIYIIWCEPGSPHPSNASWSR